jgi:hypothetical protein
MRNVFALSLALGACSASEEAATVELPVTVAPAMASATTDLGYEVQLARLRVAVEQIEFTIEGEMHDTAAVYSAPNPLGTPRPALPNLEYHPGHSAGGEVTGELPGQFILEWNNGVPQPAFGTSTLLVGNYHGANFALRNDAALGAAFQLTGTVTKDGVTRDFEATLDVEPDTKVIGAPFDDAIGAHSTETLAIHFDPTNSFDGTTVFDGVDFFALSSPIQIRPGDANHNLIRRSIQTHDHYGVSPL